MNLMDPKQDLEVTLQAYADLNFLLDPDGVILEYKSGPFLTNTFPEITPNLKIQDILPPELL